MPKIKVDLLSNKTGNEPPSIVGQATPLPTGTTQQRPTNPIVGMIRYNVETNAVEYYRATDQNWITINSFGF